MVVVHPGRQPRDLVGQVRLGGIRVSESAATTLEVYLRGGQVLTLSVTDWKLKKSNLSNELTELTWTMANADKMPFVSLGDVVAVMERA